MSGPIAKAVTGTITLSGGVGHLDFLAEGRIETCYLEPQSPNDQATYDYFVSSNDDGSGRWTNQNITGARLDDVDKLVTGHNRLGIINCTATTAVFKIVIYVERSQ